MRGEAAGGASTSGVRRPRGFAAEQSERRALGDAPEGGEEDRREEGAQSSPMASESAGRARSAADLRREISLRRGRLREREAKEMTEDIWGLL
jgi:hypothetical protein